MSNYTSYDSSMERYTSSEGLTLASGHYDTVQPVFNDSTIMWDYVVGSLVTWDGIHWGFGWMVGVFFATTYSKLCYTFCRFRRKKYRVILWIVLFAIGWWAYIFVMVLIGCTPLLIISCCFCWWCYEQCGCHNLVNAWKRFKEKRHNTRRNARMLRDRALSNPSWRRRSWIVVLRARRTRHLQTRRRRCTRDRCALPLTVAETNMAIDSWPSSTDDSFQNVVMKVVDLPEEGLFRNIAIYI